MLNLQEAFKKLNMMESSDFELLNQDEKDDMKDFLSDDSVEEEDVSIIDPQAEDEEALEDSYVGKIVVQCPVCKSLIYKTQEELDAEDEEQTCPYCFSVEKFDLIGKIVPIEDETAPEVVDEEEKEDTSDVKVEVEPKMEESVRKPRNKKPLKESKRRKVNEDLENVTIETDKDIINVSSEPKCEECDDEAPMFDEPMEEAPVEHETSEVIAPLEDEDSEEEKSVDVDEVDEDSFEDMAESFFRESYANIKGFKATKAIDKGNHMIIEGKVTLNDGKTKLTEFRIRPGKIDKSGRTTCLVENLQLGKKKVVRAYVNEGLFGKKR